MARIRIPEGFVGRRLQPYVHPAKFDRLLKAAADALERTEVGDAEEATAILEQVVTLSGDYVPPPVRRSP